MSGPAAEIIADTEMLAALAPEWWSLWRRIPSALPFLSPAWLIPWWRHFAPGRLFTLAARSEGRLVALAPAYIESGPLGRRILPLGISLSDHLDILVDADFRGVGLRLLAGIALSRRGEWDVWELENLLPDATALHLPVPEGCKDELNEQDSCPVLRIPAGRTNLLPLLPLKKRRNVRLARNRCARRGSVRIDRADASSAQQHLAHLERLHGARWDRKAEPGVLASPIVRSFQRDAVPQLASAGMLRLDCLSIGDKVAAAYYGLTHGMRTYAYLTGFDPDFDSESPVTVLMAHAFQSALAEGCREIDMLRGGEPYKYQWGAVDRRNVKRSIRQAHG
jgi:CelD/BcsL family acetyltransferase involved in cellulose biosynthesis